MNTPHIKKVEPLVKIQNPLKRINVWPFIPVYIFLIIHGVYHYFFSVNEFRFKPNFQPNEDTSIYELWENIPFSDLYQSIPNYWSLFMLPIFLTFHVFVLILQFWSFRVKVISSHKSVSHIYFICLGEINRCNSYCSLSRQ